MKKAIPFQIISLLLVLAGFGYFFVEQKQQAKHLAQLTSENAQLRSMVLASTNHNDAGVLLSDSNEISIPSDSTKGYWNTFVGAQSGLGNTTGRLNTFVGSWSGRANDSGFFNTFIGAVAGQKNTGGFHNTFVGQAAGYNNERGSNNTFIGTQSGDENVEGNDNVFVGSMAGYSNNGSLNTFIGRWSGQQNSDGVGNTFLGYRAGAHNTTGSYNVMIGRGANLADSTASNQLVVANSFNDRPLISGDFKYKKLRFSGDVEVGSESPNGSLTVNGGLFQTSPGEAPWPAEGSYALWLSDGKDGFSEGDVMIRIAANGQTKTAKLVDFESLD